MEFNPSNLPGVVGYNFPEPDQSSVSYFHDQRMNLIRFVKSFERLSTSSIDYT